MAAVIIRKKDVDRLGKELLKEMFDFLHDEYILTNFKEMKEVQEVFLKNLVFNHIITLHKQYKITKEKREVLAKPFLDTLFNIDKKVDYDPNLVKSAIKEDGIDTEGIYLTLLKINFCMEINENLYFKTKAFLDIFSVFKNAYSYLED